MNKYQNGKIYKVVCNITNEVYIGSTRRRLIERLWGHKSVSARTVCNKIIDRGDYKIVLIEKYPCNSKKELCIREGYWQSQIQCINEFYIPVS